MAYRIPNTESFIVDFDSQASICYSPFNDEILLIDANSANEIKTTESNQYSDCELSDFIRNLEIESSELLKLSRPDIRKVTKLSLIPNNICNLTCSYCYSAAGRNNNKLSHKTLETVLKWFIDPQRVENSNLSIFITGGGEPLATWDITSHAISLARELASTCGLTLHISIITNGTLLDEEKIDFLKNQKCSVGVSFDVLEDIQNSNRGKYEVVRHNIKQLLKAGMRVMINSTVIPSSVNRITEAVETVVNEYPGVAQYTVEPATGIALFGSTEKMRRFYDTFIKEYFRAKKTAVRHGLNLRFTFDDSLRGITKRHCPGKFALTPSGHFSVCHLVSSQKEDRFSDCTYGVIEGNNVIIDLEKYNRLYDVNLFSYTECEDCIAKWSCGGECFTRRSTYPPEYMEEVCRFNRKVMERLLKEAVKDVEFS